MIALKTLDGVDVFGKKVLIRLDLNVPFVDGRISDATRLVRVMGTLRELLSKGASLLLLSHFDRPKGKVVPEMSLKPLTEELSRALSLPVRFVPTDWSDDAPEEAVRTVAPGDVILFENTRFHPGEEANDAALALKMARLADLYVNDAFSASHRAHASTEGVAHLLPALAGRALQKELEALSSALTSPERPLLAVVGGAKISTKLDVLGHLLPKVDVLVISGAMANTFLKAQGISVGRSLVESDLEKEALGILSSAHEYGCVVILPKDVVVADRLALGASTGYRDLTSDVIREDEMILDIGPHSIARVERLLDEVATVVWNGPFGAFEIPPFEKATVELAQYVAKRTASGQMISIAGGGDTVSALEKAGVVDSFSYVSAAGGAFLEWLEGRKLPGVEVLLSSKKEASSPEN